MPIVDACLRAGAGGSPTAVVRPETALADEDLMRIPANAGTSHVAVLDPPGKRDDGQPVRFFTATQELPACGHGTVAVIAVLAGLHGGAFTGRLRAGGRSFAASGRYDARDGTVEAWFDQGPVSLGAADTGLVTAFLAALGLDAGDLDRVERPAIASPGRPRLLLPVADPAVLASVTPDRERLAYESRRHGQLGCFVYVPPAAGRHAVARMFAPAIGVPEDVANANSTGCLAAYLLAAGHEPAVSVDQGDALGRPSTVYATAIRTAQGFSARVGGAARTLTWK